MSGQRTSQSITSRRKCRSTVKGLSFKDLDEFVECDIQIGGKEQIKPYLIPDMPPHQCLFTVDGVDVAIFGILPMEEEGYYWSWTLYGKNLKPIHMRLIKTFAKKYLKLLKFKEIYHIIDPNKPWTRNITSFFGFSFVKHLGDRELWVLKPLR